MADADDLRRLALALDSTVEAQHFDRRAFKVARIFVTLAADGETANFMFAPEEQALKCLLAPDAFQKVPNAWGERGATTATLSRLTEDELANALETAWRRALPKPKAARRRPAQR